MRVFKPSGVHLDRFRQLAKKQAAQGLVSLLLSTELITSVPAHSQTWEKAPPLPTDMRNMLSTISKDSRLYFLYEQYRDNRDGLQKAAERISLADALTRGLATSPELATPFHSEAWMSAIVAANSGLVARPPNGMGWPSNANGCPP